MGLRGVVALSMIAAVGGGLVGFGVAALAERLDWPRR